MRIFNDTQKIIIAQYAIVADSFFPRLRGLLGRKSINQGEALVITGCQCIHMFFMQFPIDVVFVDKRNCVVGLVERIKPFCLSPFYFCASYAVELKAGSIKETGTSIGDILWIGEK